MSVLHVSSTRQLDGILSNAEAEGRLTVVDFHANWSTPCNAISPVFEVLSKEYHQVMFLKCDVDKAKAVARRYSISAMPTFVFFKGGKEVDQVLGSDKNGLHETIRKHMTSSKSQSLDLPYIDGYGKKPIPTSLEIRPQIATHPKRHSVKAATIERWRRVVSPISD